MASRELVLLSPYRLPTQQPLTLADEDMAAWLNGYSALWHPAALWQAGGPPRVQSAHDHAAPLPGHIYAVPVTPQSLLPEDWDALLSNVGAVAFRATPDRAATLANLKAALTGAGQGGQPTVDPVKPASDDEHAAERKLLAMLPDKYVAAFLGVGMGFVLLSTLGEAMDHESQLDAKGFWIDVQQALASAAGLTTPPDAEKAHEEPQLESEIERAAGQETPDPELQPWQLPLRSAARRLLAAREMLYPVSIHLLDLVLLEEQNPQEPWPITVTYGKPVNVIASAAVLQNLHSVNAEATASLAEAVKSKLAEVCGGSFVEREDIVLPLESQLWNLRRGLAVTRDLLGSDVKVFATRQIGVYPQLPSWLSQLGINRAILLGAETGLPAYYAPVVTLSTSNGQELSCFVRKGLPTDSVASFFNLGHHLYKTVRQDHTATLAFVHGKGGSLPWYEDLLELARYAPVAGTWTTLSSYFGESTAGEHAGNLGPDDLHFDYLTQRASREAEAGSTGVANPPPRPLLAVSGFARHARLRRRLDTCWTLAALLRGLAGHNDPIKDHTSLQALEDGLEDNATEATPPELLNRLADLEKQIGGALGDRLTARAQSQQAGYLLLNPCSFARRLALELEDAKGPIPIADPVKAVQLDGSMLRVVAEVPPLGFAWLPQQGPPGTPMPAMRVRLADERCVRNEFFEAEIDLSTGGLRALRDHKTPLNRICERLIFRPGSVMKATKITTTSTGPALGEIITEGVLLGTQNQELAKFRQRYRAWLGRPILDLRVELYAEQPVVGNPWSAYFGAQFAWRDERAVLSRGVGGSSYVTMNSRPQTPDYVEIRMGQQSTTVFPMGLPFHQREGGRMLDVILLTPGESAQLFDLAIGLDREQPMQTALGLVTPATVIPTSKGPPHIGAKGWLFHLDAPNLLLTSMRPGGQELAADGTEGRLLFDAVTVRLLECAGLSTPAELRCVRNPERVSALDLRGQLSMPGTHSGDAALLQVGSGNLVQLQVEFSL